VWPLQNDWVDTSTETAQKYGVMSIPTLIIFKGGQVVSTLVGFRPKEALVVEVNKILI